MEPDSYKETFETWNKIANLYQDKFMQLDLYNESYDFVCNLLTNNRPSILELGCGPGNITKYLLSKRPDFNILATDIAPNMIALAKQNNPSARCEVMDSRYINQLTEKFDALISGFCIPYLSAADCDQLIDDAAKLLLPKGIAYISFVEGAPEQSGYQQGSSGDRTYFYYHNLESLCARLVNNNFEIIKIFKVPYKKANSEIEYHTILIAKKD